MEANQLLQSDVRYCAASRWLGTLLPSRFIMTPLAGDASFRRYFRVKVGDTHYVLMDAPADKESSAPFVAVASGLSIADVRVPRIYHMDLQQGFLLLEDFGDALYLTQLNSVTAPRLYALALDSLLKIQRCQDIPNHPVPTFSAQRMQDELNWFELWYIEQYQHYKLSADQKLILQSTYHELISQAQSQPQVLVHKDYHSRNLLLLSDNTVGVIDFQDALWGPITYDIMSLFYDHYISWPYEKVKEWVRPYHQQLLQEGLLEEDNFSLFMQWHDWLALQRILKNLGNFVRLNIKYKKPGYLQDIPRIYGYILDISRRYESLSTLHELLLLWKPEGAI